LGGASKLALVVGLRVHALDADRHHAAVALLAGRSSGVSIVVGAMTRIVASKLKAEPHRNGIEVRMLERKPAPEAAVGVASSS
jgi:hypothetical protein